MATQVTPLPAVYTHKGILLARKGVLRARVSLVANGVAKYALNQYLVQLMTSLIIRV